MIHFPISIYIELVAGFFLWWFAVYLINQNPRERFNQHLFVIFTSLSIYFVTDIFFVAADYLKQYEAISTLLKACTWTIYIPFACFYHLSYLLLKKKNILATIFLYLNYGLAFIAIYLEVGTNLLRNHALILSPDFNGSVTTATGKYFWIVGIFMFFTVATALMNFLSLLKNEKKFSNNWWKYFWPCLALISNIILGPLILMSYYDMIPHSVILPAITFSLTALFTFIAVIKYRLFIEEPRILFGKNFLYSTLAMIFIVGIFSLLIIFQPLKITSVGNLFIPILLIYFFIASMPFYSWVNTFINDLIYNSSLGFSVVTDQEISVALKNYQTHEVLENNSLLRLNIVNKKIKEKEIETPVDALRIILKQAIEYFKPEESPHKRIKANLKYQLLRMITFNQAEEGQILWELGFMEYPTRIISREKIGREPLFFAESASDYSYTSRNAYLALKKEAIHDVTWRISYLEKLSKSR